jgi:serine phosphatase RsbU (regulator of sigma subunit)
MENEKPLSEYPEEIRGYIKELREEAKDNRIKLSEFEKQANEFKTLQEGLLSKEREEKELKEKEYKEKLEKQQEFQKLYELSQNKLKELESVKNKYDEIQKEIESERQAYIKKLPLEKRDIYAEMPLKVIKDVVETISKSSLEYSAGAEKVLSNNGEVDFSKMSADQIQESITTNPALKESYWGWVEKQL